VVNSGFKQVSKKIYPNLLRRYFLLEENCAMADLIDIANDLIDNELSRALNKLRQQVTNNNEGTEFCVECGETIPAERKKLGFKRCVSCAEEAERRGQMFVDY
jgi:RNA polymerase-binding transcription factor DksA